jgi:hypothetical protein
MTIKVNPDGSTKRVFVQLSEPMVLALLQLADLPYANRHGRKPAL